MTANTQDQTMTTEQRIEALLASMSLSEKIGQMHQVMGSDHHVSDDLREQVQSGKIGSVINIVSIDMICELQRIAMEESRLGIPLLMGRDVIHGFKTVFPIPLGQAASWNPDVIEQGASIAAQEAASVGVNWTFAPMIDVARDPRWGRIAESLGEDPYLCSQLGAAMVRGFQGDNMSDVGRIAACAKHFAGYGAAEAGMDYNTTIIGENDLRNVYLPPFKAAADAGVATFMTAFNDLNGVPASGNEFLLKQVLREEWLYSGMVVSDWESISQLTEHGFTANDKDAAFEAANAGVDMEMVSRCYADNLESLIAEERVSLAQVDACVSNILRVKFDLGLFENPYAQPDKLPAPLNQQHREAAKQAALESVVLLKNSDQCLPLKRESLNSLAVIGPLATDPYEQLGTWIFDGDVESSEPLLPAITALASEHLKVSYAQGMDTTRSHSQSGFAEAVALAEASDQVVLCLGEESILSGEAHSRASIELPGCQAALIDTIAELGKPLILVVMAGRPLALESVVDKVDAILYAWHPGTMGGPALAELLFGLATPSGKLPVTFPRVTGQIPMYYAKKNTGKPPTPETVVHIDTIESRAPQTSLGMSAFHLDAGFTPLFSFGHGLSYTEFEYRNLELSSPVMSSDGKITVSAELQNTGDRSGTEVVQLYVRDLVGNVTRPVKELKGFQRVSLNAQEARRVEFTIDAQDLAFYDRKMNRVIESGQFHVWIAGDSESGVMGEFEIVGSGCRHIPH